MALIHFAFGSHHREGNLKGQCESFIEHILIPKQLRASGCVEFKPILSNQSNSMLGLPSSAKLLADNSLVFNTYVKLPPVLLLPIDIMMISFVNINFNKLGDWGPSEHYGKLGLVFTDKFLSKNKIKKVSYYDFLKLPQDDFVISLDKAIKTSNIKEQNRLTEIVVNYRKPAMLWPEFNDEFSVIKMNSGSDGVTKEHITYSRYEEGYKFIDEQEWRLVKSIDNLYLPFTEEDVFAIVVPNKDIENIVLNTLEKCWKKLPSIIEYPN